MNPNESWIAEQARLIDLEDGFGPGYSKPLGVTTSTEESASRSPGT